MVSLKGFSVKWVFCLCALAGGILVGYLLPHQNAPAPAEESTGFFGLVRERVSENAILVQQIFGTDQPGANAYIVTIDKDTVLTHQKSKEGEKASFAQEKGKNENIVKDMYVFVTARDPLVNSRFIRTSDIIYSEQTPFAQ